MTLKSMKILAVLATSVSWTATASAQSLSAEDAAALRAELQALKAQVQALEARVGQAETATTAATETAQKATELAAKKDDGIKIKFKGAPEISDEKSGWSFKPRGRLLFDAASVNAPSAIADRGLGFSNEVRRARLGVEGDIPGGFGYKFELDFATGEAELTDAFLDYKSGGLTVTVGQHNNFQSLEELSSSNDTSFMERAAFTDAFGFKRRIGVSAQYHSGIVLAQAGVFTDNATDLSSDENDSVSVDTRLVLAPKLGDAQLHFGVSAHWRDLGDSVTSVRYRQRPLVHSTDTRFIDTGTLGTPSDETGYGAEAAVIAGRFHAAGEAYWQKTGFATVADPTFFGGAIEAGFFLTDDSREYKSGVFKGVKVKNPVGQGGIGAVQFNVRYDHLDLTDAGIVGGTQDGYMASLIWTPVSYVRFMLNYARLEYKNAAVRAAGDASYGVDVLGARTQVSF
ncbi:MAG: porin [Sphingobium sp.]